MTSSNAAHNLPVASYPPSRETKYLHYRLVDGDAVSATNPHGIMSRQGLTVAYRHNEDGVIEFATAKCHPWDNFSKKMGRIKSGNRLKSDKIRETTDLTDRSDFIDAMDSEVYSDYGYVRIG